MLQSTHNPGRAPIDPGVMPLYRARKTARL
jgi:hypothetical protein